MEQGHWVLAKLGKRVLRPGGRELTAQMLEAMNINETDDVVEFAPGLGQTARLTVAHKPHSYTAVELNEEAASRVRHNVNYANMRVVAADAAQTGLPDACATKVYGEAMLTMQSDRVKAEIVSEAARLLRPGGRLVLRDDHPVFMAVGDDASHGLTLHEPYFQQDEPMTWQDEGSYVEAPADAAPIAHTRNHQWNHAVGEILTALLGAGLVLEEVGETRVSAWRRWPDLMEPCEGGYRFTDPALRDMLPLQLVVVARRPGGPRP